MKPLTPETIKRRLKSIRRAERAACSAHTDALALFAARVEVVQSLCAHQWVHESDPAGDVAARWCSICKVDYTPQRDAAAKRLTISVTPTK